MYRHFIEITGLFFLAIVALSILLAGGTLFGAHFVAEMCDPLLTLLFCSLPQVGMLATT